MASLNRRASDRVVEATSTSLADRLDGIPRKQLVMGVDGHHKKLVVAPEARALVGRIISAAFEHSGLTNKDAAFRMGYGDDLSPISRWTSGQEPPQMARFFSVPELRHGLAVALAEVDPNAEVRTVLTFKTARRA